MSEKAKRAEQRPGLEGLLRAAKNHVMTPEEYRAQERSWAVGQLMLTHPEMAREKAEAVVDDVLARQPQLLPDRVQDAPRPRIIE